MGGKLKNPKDIVGNKYGRLVVLDFDDIIYYKNCNAYIYKYKCQCECGNITTVRRGKLLNGYTQSCGCLHKERTAQKNKNYAKYGGSAAQYNRLYNIWHKMRSRCRDVQNSNYKNYGGRGIQICDEWYDNWENFKNWALFHGYQDNLSIDRIDNNGNYEPNNCRWTTRLIQANNTSKNKYITINGRTQTLANWCREYNVPYDRVRHRLKDGNMTPLEALTLPKKEYLKNYGEGIFKENNVLMLIYNEEIKSLKEWQTTMGFPKNSTIFAQRVKRGWSAKQIIETPYNYKCIKESNNEK